MTWPYPGKVLVIDDKFDEDETIQEAFRQLLLNGVPVQYWTGKGKARFPNTRIVLLDLILSSADALLTGPEKFDRAIDALCKIPSASIAILLTSNPDEPSDFKARLDARLTEGYPWVIASTKIEKQEVASHQIIISRIDQEIRSHPEVQLAMLLESIIDRSKDGAFHATLGRNVGVVKALIKILDKQSGGAGPRRELVDTMIRVLSRHAHSGEAYDELKRVLDQMLRDGPPDLANSAANLLSFLMYYKPEDSILWTGDIFRRRRAVKDIRVVITPSCDLLWDRPTHVSVVNGFALTEQVYTDRSSILFEVDPTLRDFVATERNATISQGARDQATRQIEARIRRYKEDERQLDLPESSYFLRHVDIGEGLTDIYLDLKDVNRVPLASLKTKGGNWTRVARIDAPFVERLLQRFGEGASRIGVPDFNLSLVSLQRRAYR